MEHTQNLNVAVATDASLTSLSGSDAEEVVTEYEVTSQELEKQEKQEKADKSDSDDDLPPLVEDTDEDFQWNYLQVETQETYRELHRRMFEELLESVRLTDENKNQQQEEHSENEDTENQDTKNEDTENEDADDEASPSDQESESDDDLPPPTRRNEGPPSLLVFFTLLFVLLHIIQLAFLLQEKRERDAHPCFRVYRP